MTAGVAAQVASIPDIPSPGGGGAGALDPILLFTVPGTQPARIESVSMNVQGTAWHDFYVLQLVDQSGAIIYSVSSPVVDMD